jgi:outer membrane protein assembly factor BamE (lipoprotein component of BamABCDE complex)
MQAVTKNLAIALACVGLLAGCFPSAPTQDPAVTLDQLNRAFAKYESVKAGMGYDAVSKIMGFPGEKIVISEAERTAQPNVPVPREDAWDFVIDDYVIKVGFVNGPVSIKSFAWETPIFFAKTNARTTVSKYGQVKAGMTVKQVVSILGSPGLRWMSMETYRVRHSSDAYVWWPEDEPDDSPSHMMTISFADGLVQFKSYDGVTEAK